MEENQLKRLIDIERKYNNILNELIGYNYFSFDYGGTICLDGDFTIDDVNNILQIFKQFNAAIKNEKENING